MPVSEYKDKGNYHSLRCSETNPQHVYVNQLLTDLNLDIFKSKNQFMIDAIDFYAKYLNEQHPMDSPAPDNQQGRMITEDDLEHIKNDIFNEVMKEVQKEVIAMLGAAISGRQTTEPVQNVTTTEEVKETTSFNINPTVANMAMLWGNDEE